jgi:polysaccharide pyruvyl transferase WcaK-like protein
MITKIILAGGYNVGDELVFKASLERDKDEKQFIICYKPKNVIKRFKEYKIVDAVTLFNFPKNIPKVIKYAMKSRKLEIGGGGLVSYDLRVNFFIFLYKLLGREVNFVQAGCIPLNQVNKKKWIRFLTTKIALKLSNDVSVRDFSSQNILKKKFGVKSRVWKDAVWTYPIKKVKKRGKKLAINIKIINTTPEMRQLSQDKIVKVRKIIEKMNKKDIDFIYINPADKKLIEKEFSEYNKVQMPINVDEFIKKLSKYGTLISFRKHPFWIAERLGLKTIPIVIDKAMAWRK